MEKVALKPYSAADSYRYVYEYLCERGIHIEYGINTTDEQLHALINECEQNLNKSGFTLHIKAARRALRILLGYAMRGGRKRTDEEISAEFMEDIVFLDGIDNKPIYYDVEISADNDEREEFAAWLISQGHTAEVGRSTGNYIDGGWTDHDHEADDIMRSLWEAYCEQDLKKGWYQLY